jgi:hypothetical protein
MTSPSRWTVRTSDVAVREIEGEVVVLDVSTRQYHALNRTGGALWQQLEAGATDAELAATLTDRFGADPREAGADVRAFLDGLVALQLLRPVPEAGR